MFESVRSHRRWLMLFLLLLVFPSFVVTGIYSYNRFMSGDNAIATVGGQPITQQEFDAAHREQVERLKQMFGGQVDSRMFDSPQAKAGTLEGLLAERALSREAVAGHVLISEERLRELIAAEPSFQTDGKFDYDKYKRLLAAQGLTELGFEQRVRGDIARQLLLQSVAGTAIVPKAVAEQVRRLTDEQREVRELRFNPQDFKAKLAVGDDEIRKYYDASQAEFQTPESVKAEYVVLTLDDIAAQVPAVSEADARAYYDQNQSKYGQAEERRASHILLTAGDGGSAKDKDGARRKAQEILARLKANPGEFEKLAREQSKDPGSAAQGGDLGWFGRNMMVKPFEEAAFALKEGQLSDVVESDFGFHLIKVTGVKGAQVKPFDEVRASIETELKRQAAGKRFAEVAEQFSNSVYEQADSLKPVADKLKLQVLSIDTLTRAGVPPRPGAPQLFTPRLVEALFTDEAIKNKRNTEAIEVAPNTLVAARVVEHRPAAVRPLTEVRDQIKARVEQREAARLAREAGQARLAELQKTPADTGFAAARTISRSNPLGLPQQAVTALMQVPADKLPAFVGAELDGGTFGVFQVLSAKIPDKQEPQQAQAQAQALMQTLGAADDGTYVSALRSKHKAQVVNAAFKVEKAATK